MKDNYKKYSDEDIITAFQNGDKNAVDYLMEKYKNLVRKKARSMYLIGGDNDDLIQEGMIGLYKSIRDYDESYDSSFYSFANLCITRQMYSAIKASNRKKNIPLNTYISLNSPVYSDSSEIVQKENLEGIMAGGERKNPEELFIDKENTSMIEYELGRRLSSLEKKVLKLYMSGHEYIQIAEILNRKPKSIDNTLQRIKIKLNRLLKEI